MQRALVIGHGSIGSRHARILRELGLGVSVVSRRPVEGYTHYGRVPDAVLAECPEVAVIANETSEHLRTLDELHEADFAGRALIEKPLAAELPISTHFPADRAWVAYNFRFHPALEWLAKEIGAQRVVSVDVYAGQYLPDWRPQRDYRSTYSADAARGGGVLRDLSHELDYLVWLFGSWQRVCALGGQLGDLGIDADDAWGILLECERCPLVTLQLNYLDRFARREIIVNTASGSIHLDLMNGRGRSSGGERDWRVERDESYRRQAEALMRKDMSRMCTLEEGVEVMGLIDAIERSACEQRWVSR